MGQVFHGSRQISRRGLPGRLIFSERAWNPMNDEMVLIVRLRVEKSMRNVVRDSLLELFAWSKDERTFVSATVLEDIEDSEQLLVCEVWRETRESFLANQMSKPYRSNYEKMLVELRVERTPQLLKPVGSWNRHTVARTSNDPTM